MSNACIKSTSHLSRSHYDGQDKRTLEDSVLRNPNPPPHLIKGEIEAQRGDEIFPVLPGEELARW